MKRRLLNLLTALSLLLCVAACVLWGRTYFVEDRVYRSSGDRLFVAYSEDARLHLGFVDEPGGPVAWDRTVRRSSRDFEAGHLRVTPHWRIRPRDASLTLPYSLLCLLAGIAPAWRGARWAGARIRRRRAPKCGLCPSCGYDLRASPGRCPECGAAASVTTTG